MEDGYYYSSKLKVKHGSTAETVVLRQTVNLSPLGKR